ncbi:MAG: heme exporter protein CcmD [Pseudomonadota bacterium]
MMPDLGIHAAYVLSAYAVTLTLLAGLIGLSWLRSNRVRRMLDTLEHGKQGEPHER